ncbi:uncharacterized protein LOC132273100 [Cornus florida]|uniref:uncharacterized protein LOC132273100 n=1 Tax=Cornus florida TaxID=4283 RepID=UPI00289BF153|nr:uncharacterized protein LOC132273100 [Cornus florida]
MRCLGPDRTKEPPPSKDGEEEPPVLTTKPLHEVKIDHKKPDQTTKVGSRLTEEEKLELTDFLTRNADVFAWSHSDMPGINPSVSCHSLNVDPNVKPVKQKQRRFAPERNQIITEKVDRLLEAGFIREVQYPAWLSNIVVVQKKNGKWKVCIDFTNLNKACPKDSFLLPRIDQMVDATTGYERLTFLDAYFGYNQIPIDPVDEEKTSFVTERGTYCYKVMPFELKNAGATYQRLISKIFKRQMGRTVEAYIDDIVVKSKKKNDHLAHLQDMFDVLRQYRMKLNPAKCSFGVSSGQFLGHMVNHRGIEASPVQAEALIRNAEPKTIKEVQALTGRIATLSRFISKLSDRCTTLSQAIRLEFNATNNEAEYEALIAGLKLAKELKIKNLIAYSDSQLIIRQVTGEYGTKDKTMEAYRTAVLRKAKGFDQIRFIQLPREYNEDADRLAYSASSSGETLARVIPVDVLVQPSIFNELPDPSAQHINVIPYEPSWIDPIMAFICNGVLPEQKDKARKIRSNAAKYAIVRDQLYRRSFSGPYLKCATLTEARQIIRTIHEGVCRNHSEGRSLAHKAMTQGYFWPNMARDTEEFSRRCDKCQRFGPLIHQPLEDLHVMATPWLFTQWGIDVVGPLLTARSQNKYVMLATDYFTKWVEAEPHPSVT